MPGQNNNVEVKCLPECQILSCSHKLSHKKAMLKNYFKIAIRHFLRYKSYSLINIVGLGLGIAAALLIGLYVSYEWSFDKYHPKADRVFRVVGEMHFGEKVFHSATASSLLKEELMDNFAEVESAVRLAPFGAIDRVKYKDEVFWGDTYAATGQEVFDIFSLEWLEGRQEDALTAPFRVVLTRPLAEKYFGEGNAVGEVLEIEYNGEPHQLEVAGVIGALPGNTHLEFDALVSYATREALAPSEANWTSLNRNTYVLLRRGSEAEELAVKVNAHIEKLVGKPVFYNHYLQPLWDIHLNTLGLGIEADGDPRKLYLFGTIALLILLIGCINFVNLATARAAVRMKEIGLRKVLGAERRQLFRQFITEALLYSFLSALAAVGLANLALPFFNRLLDIQLSLQWWEEPRYLLALLGLIVFTGLLAGSYPAVYLSGFRPIQLRSAWKGNRQGGINLRKGLVAGQFLASVVLIASTLVVYRQMQYIRNLDLGFDKEQVVYLKLRDENTADQYERFRSEMENLPEITAAAVASSPIGEDFGAHGFLLEGQSEKGPGMMVNVLCVDEHYRQAMGLRLAAGRWFSADFATDAEEGFVVNESAARLFGWEEPVGQYLNRNGQKGRVLGVVQDFNYEPLHQPIKPLVLYHTKREEEYAGAHSLLVLKLVPGNMAESINAIRSKWNHLAADVPFDYQFMDETLAGLYEAEYRFGWLAGAFAVLAIFIACLGLLGLAAFSAQQRTKEVGIRKVLGATVASIIGLLSKDVLKLAAVSVLLASPLAWYAMNRWLEGFAYRIHIQWWMLALAGLAVMLAAFLTVSLQSLRVARGNPADALRSE